MQPVFHIRLRLAPEHAAPVVTNLSPYPLGDNRLGVCSRSLTRLARRVLYLIVGGGDLQSSKQRRSSRKAGASPAGRIAGQEDLS